MVRINGFVSLTPNHSFFKIKIQKSHPEKKGYNYPGFQKKTKHIRELDRGPYLSPSGLISA
jgi:hypothetical protein